MPSRPDRRLGRLTLGAHSEDGLRAVVRHSGLSMHESRCAVSTLFVGMARVAIADRIVAPAQAGVQSCDGGWLPSTEADIEFRFFVIRMM